MVRQRLFTAQNWRPAALLVALALAASICGLQIWRRLEHAPRVLKLPDGVEIVFRWDTKITPTRDYGRTREILIDGDAFIRTPPGPTRWIVKSRLLVLTVSGGSELRVTAYSNDAGEQSEVLRGHVVARKAYQSPYMEPDELRDGETVLINKTIDLMEKESTDRAALERWSRGLRESARKR